MIENARPSGLSASHKVKIRLAHTAVVAVLLVLFSGTAWAEEPSGGSAEPRGETAAAKTSNSRESFGNTLPPKDQNAVVQTPIKAMGGGKSSFADGPPKPPSTPQLGGG